MIHVISEENDTLIDYPKEKIRTAAIRVSLMEGGASGPFLGLSLDEEKPQDQSFHVQGLTFVVDKSLLKLCGTIEIDFIETGNSSGFKITAANPLISKDEKYSSGPYEQWTMYH